jgi:hypothetical protein
LAASKEPDEESDTTCPLMTSWCRVPDWLEITYGVNYPEPVEVALVVLERRLNGRLDLGESPSAVEKDR